MENCDGDGGGRRRHLAPEERTDSTNLRDFLRVKEDNVNRNNSLAGLTLGAVLTGDKSPGRPQSPALAQSQSNRTLLDIIRDDPTVTKESKKSWKAFKEKLRLRRTGAAWTSTVPIPASDVPIQTSANRMISRRESVRFPTTDPDESIHNNESTRPQLNSVQSSRAMLLRRNTSRIPERQASRLVPTEVNISAVDDVEVDEEEEEGTGESSESPEGEAETGGGGGEQPQVRMSLMALLAETDREMGIDGGGYLMDDDEEDDEEEEVESGGGGGGGEYNNCCVCMVRHKGAAFIPCGHTFCRLCSRELWVQRGNCPLCNNFILEILDIF